MNDRSEIEESIFRKMESSLSEYLFEQKENRIIHATLNEEMSDFVPVRDGDIKAVKHLLSYNEYTCTDIAEYLGFSGGSHFSALFTKYEGISPKEYRKKYYQKQFSNLKDRS